MSARERAWARVSARVRVCARERACACVRACVSARERALTRVCARERACHDINLRLVTMLFKGFFSQANLCHLFCSRTRCYIYATWLSRSRVVEQVQRQVLAVWCHHLYTTSIRAIFPSDPKTDRPQTDQSRPTDPKPTDPFSCASIPDRSQTDLRADPKSIPTPTANQSRTDPNRFQSDPKPKP